MISVERKRIVIDGTPRVLISGEIHYYRLPREAWKDRVLKLKAARGKMTDPLGTASLGTASSLGTARA